MTRGRGGSGAEVSEFRNIPGGGHRRFRRREYHNLGAEAVIKCIYFVVDCCRK